MRVVYVGAVVLATGLAGCATLVRGTSDHVSVLSEPAGATVSTSYGANCTTPCSLDVKRNASFTVLVSKPGYQSRDVAVTTRLASAGAAAATENIATGGLGLAVDVATGATLEHVPNPVSVVLRPLAISPAAKPRRSPVS